MIQDEVQHSIGDSRVFLNAAGNTEKNTAKEEWIELKGIDVEVVEEKGEIADRIGRALNQLKDISLQHPDKLISHISAKVQDAVKNSINPEEAASLQVTEKEEGLLVEDESGNSSDELEKTELKDRKKGIETGELRDNKVFVSESEDIVGDKSVTLSYDVSQKEVQDTGFSQTVESKAPVSKQEIFTQVVEKAKVLLSGEKSEMVIDLKPDHLGKLALKIATERGIVVAKFIAENEQVKAALESNMNMLKESLEKQGFLVQEFSVSVGDNRERSGYEDNMKKGNFAKKGLKDELPAIGMVGVESLEQLHTGINSYIDGTSSINLTA
jgi:flagellar hook-length control protein FliK